MKTSGVIASAVAASLAVAGCTTLAPAAPPTPLTTFSVIGPCGASVPPPTPSETYNITIKNNFELRDAVVEMSGHPQPPHSHAPPRAHQTRLDIITDLQEGQSGTVKLILTDPLLNFQEAGLAVRGGDDDAAKIFCSVVYHNGDRQLSFTVHRDVGGPTYGLYDLGLIVTDKHNGALTLPLFIDPGVDNDGVAF
jgi:hypothetical protein